MTGGSSLHSLGGYLGRRGRWGGSLFLELVKPLHANGHAIRPAWGPHLHHHEGLAVPAERVLQQVGELGVAEGHVALAGT